MAATLCISPSLEQQVLAQFLQSSNGYESKFRQGIFSKERYRLSSVRQRGKKVRGAKSFADAASQPSLPSPGPPTGDG